MNLRLTYYNYKVRHHEPRTTVYHNYEDINSILIIFESDLLERHLQVKQLIKELQNDDKDVTAWGYIDKKEPLTAVLRDFRVIGNNSLNIMHCPKKELLEELRNMHFDLLIDLTSTADISAVLPLRYLALNAHADIKAGRGGYAEPYIHDLIIDLQEGQDDAAFLFDQITHYLKQIKAG